MNPELPRSHHAAAPGARAHGFTLVEVLVAVAVGGMLLLAISTTFVTTVRRNNEVENIVASNTDGNRILALVERDLRSLWHHNIKGDTVLIGRDRSIVGAEADWIDLVCTSDSLRGTYADSNELAFPSLCEVGYWLKQNATYPDLIELWRREDPLIDDDITTGGTFQLVSDRLRSFKITYYETVGEQADPLDEWDSRREGRLPRRIKIEFKLHRRLGSANEVGGVEVDDIEETETDYVRHIVFDARYPNILQPGVAMISIAPPPPEASGPGGPIGGGGGPLGGAGPLGGGGPAGGSGPGRGGAGPDGGGRGGRSGGDAGGGRSGSGGGGNRPGGNQQPPINLGDLLRGIGGGAGGNGLPPGFGGR
ncbi:MAG: prepilin-type N-terminal cleavage/methylation domain-containing protein [Planctomycetes bacterium]|nr:prepilin-type N-terminal cleavage/methylation domain-containing protein [Planctomycetota bacterium]